MENMVVNKCFAAGSEANGRARGVRDALDRMRARMRCRTARMHGFLACKKGQGTTEYAILVGVLVVIAIVAITLFRPKIEEASECYRGWNQRSLNDCSFGGTSKGPGPCRRMGCNVEQRRFRREGQGSVEYALAIIAFLAVAIGTGSLVAFRLGGKLRARCGGGFDPSHSLGCVRRNFVLIIGG